MEGHEPPQPQPKSSPDELCPASNPCVITPLSPAPADSKAATPKSDAQGATPATGPMTLPTPQELPPASEPQDILPDQEEEGGTSWRYHPAVQGVSGFLGGVAFGVIPFAGVGEGVAQARGWIDKRTRAANIGKGIGEIVGGLFTFSGGVGGVVGGGALTVTGIGAPAGVPAIVASAALVTGALANVAAGVATIQVALSQGGGGDGGSGAAPLGNASPAAGGNAFRVDNSKMPHAAQRAVERAGFATKKDATDALRVFGQGIEQNGLPSGTVRDAAGHLIVPGFGEGGAVVYRLSDGKLTLQTVLTWIEGTGTPFAL